MNPDVIFKPTNNMVSGLYRMRSVHGWRTKTLMDNPDGLLPEGNMLPKHKEFTDIILFSRPELLINAPPTFTSTPVTTATAGSVYIYNIAVTDPDGEPLIINGAKLPDWLKLIDNGDGTAVLKGTPHVTDCSDKQVMLVVKEKGEDGMTTEQSFEINITADLTVSIETDRSAICVGEPVIFTATLPHSVPNPVYEWFIDDVLVAKRIGDPIFPTNSIREDRLVKVKVTIEPTECIKEIEAMSEPLLIEVKESLETSVTVEVEKTSICADENASFTAILIEGGPNPVYTWFVNNQAVEEETSLHFISDFLEDGDIVSVEVTTDEASCTTTTNARAEVTMNVIKNLTLSVALTSDKKEITVGDIVTFTASTTYANSALRYEWFVNGQIINGETAPTFTASTLENNDKVKVKIFAEPIDCLENTEAESDEFAISVNDAAETPVVQDITKITDEDVSMTFSSSDFSKALSGDNSLASIRIITLPAKGMLTLNGTGVTVNQEITEEQLSGLTYFPDANLNGEDAFAWNGSDGAQFAEKAATVKITIKPLNDPPEFTLSGNVVVLKNFNTVEAVTVTPAEVPADEVNQTVTYQLIPPTVSFANIIFDAQSGRVTITSVLDQTGKQEFEIIANDGQAANHTHIESFVLEVKDANTFPPKDITADNLFISENQQRGTLIGTITVIDDDADDRHVLSLDDHNDLFFIDGNQLKTIAVLDFEQQVTYVVSVRATDLGGNFLVEPFTITVTNENDLPTTLRIDMNEIMENEPIGTQVGKLTAMDQDEEDILTFSLVADVADNALFSLFDNVLVSDVVFDFEEGEAYEIRVRVDDGNGGVIEEVIMITVIDVEPENIEVVSGFTPDNDRINDTWEIPGLVSYPRCRVEVFNSWGQRVFFSRGYRNPWDGTFKSKYVPIGTYYYIIDLDNGQPPITGDITVMR